MVRFYYDDELAQEFLEDNNGNHYLLGSAGSIMLGCMTCGAIHFRDQVYAEDCFEGHGRLVPITRENMEAHDAVWLANNPGGRLWTAEERRAARAARHPKSR